MAVDPVHTAELRARQHAADPTYRGGPREPIQRPRRLAIGDPQAPLAKFLEILHRHAALGPDGRLAADVHLVSIGDHFDWGTRSDRQRAADDGLSLLAWLAAHAADQVTLIAGNHDLARVGELAGFDDASFREAQAEADVAYHDGAVDRAAEARLLERHPELPTAEILARDLGTFHTAQRTLVGSLLRARRFALAIGAGPDLLLSHAGVTQDEIGLLALPGDSPAPRIAAALDAALDRAVAQWRDGEPLGLPGLLQPGRAATGEARGFVLHRPGNREIEPHNAPLYAGPPRRRYAPDRLPAGLTQAVGHIRDKKCRELLGPWAEAGEPRDGPLRHMRVEDGAVRYRRGLPEAQRADAATMLFLDGGMLWADPGAYELLDLDTRRAARR